MLYQSQSYGGALMPKDITALFCFVDDFYQAAMQWIQSKLLPCKKPTRTPAMSDSEILTIILLYHQSPCKNFKYFYESYLPLYSKDFSTLLSYSRFIYLKKRVLIYLLLMLEWFCHQTKNTGISYIDSTSIAVCHPKRISRNKVFAGFAKLGKTTKGWFFGLKLHLVINHKGEIQGLQFTAGNVDDREPVLDLTQHLTGLLFGDKGYIKQELFEALYEKGLKLVTGLKKNMKNKLMPMFERVLLRKRSVVETVFDILKCHFEIEHTRHRSVTNAIVHFFSTLVAYCLKPSKPAISNPT
jgi:Transposase DDE domain